MRITEITVSAGITLPHGKNGFASLRPHIQLRATIEGGDNPQIVAKCLQEQAEGLLSRHIAMATEREKARIAKREAQNTGGPSSPPPNEKA